MPSKEEIEQYKIRLNNHIKTNIETISESTTSIGEQELLLAVNNDLEGALKLIKQLEAEKKAIINKTETKIEELKKEYYTEALPNNSIQALVLKSQIMILEEIMKGKEKHESND